MSSRVILPLWFERCAGSGAGFGIEFEFAEFCHLVEADGHGRSAAEDQDILFFVVGDGSGGNQVLTRLDNGFEIDIAGGVEILGLVFLVHADVKFSAVQATPALQFGELLS